MIQVITGPGTLCQKVEDFLNMADYEHVVRQGAFLIRLTTSQADLNAHKTKIDAYVEMKEQAAAEW